MRRLLIEMPELGLNRTDLPVLGCTIKSKFGEHLTPRLLPVPLHPPPVAAWRGVLHASDMNCRFN
jgi:hypothetical protein